MRSAARKLLGLEEVKRRRLIPGIMSFLGGAKRQPSAPGEAAPDASRLHA
jgi:hypothetical protein